MTTRFLVLVNRTYEFLLLAYPGKFRQRFGSEMASVFAESCGTVYRRSGTAAVIALCCRTAGDFIVSMCSEHVVEFVAAVKWDCRTVSGQPGFCAATSVVLSILFFVSRITLADGVPEAPRESFLLFAITSAHVAALWAASVIALHVSDGNALARPLSSPRPVFVERVRAFRHLASIALLCLLCPTIRVLMCAQATLRSNNYLGPLPTPADWLIGPVALLIIISAFFALAPLLTPRNHVSSASRIIRREQR
jgi:hypothetical protein